MRIEVKLTADRWNLGQLSVLGDNGAPLAGFPVPCDGKSDNAAAAEHGNPERDPTKPFGDTPLGNYNANVAYVENTPQNQHSFGNPDATGEIPTIDLHPVTGDTQAWCRQENEGVNKPMGLKIHGGALDAEGRIRVTHGCLRVSNDSMRRILASVAGHFLVSIEL